MSSRDRPLRVLVVDDHPGFRRSARALLESDGLDVVGEAADGPGCLDAVRRLSPDVVILDVVLRDEDGFAVAEMLADARSTTAVVLMSSRSRAEFGPRTLVDPIRGFLDKDELSGAALRALLAR